MKTIEGKCLRIRLEGKTKKHIKKCANDLRLNIKKIYEKDNKKNGYNYYAYGNTIKHYEEE